MVFFIFLQILLISGFYLSNRSLLRRKSLITPLGVTINAWYSYLLIYYGPTSVFVILGPEYVEPALNRPWLLSHAYIGDTLPLAFFPFLLPCVLTLWFLRYKKNPLSRLLLYPLRPALTHPYNLLFGVLGSIIQFLATILVSPTWSTASFSEYSPLFKFLGSSSVVLSISPQLVIAIYTYYSSRSKLSVGPQISKLIFITSSVIGFFCFSSFSLRTSLLLLCAIVFVTASQSIFCVSKRLAFCLFIALSYIAYACATLPVRVHPLDSERSIANKINASLVYDISYRSGFGTESAILASKDCLHHNQLSLTQILIPEFIRGMPSQLRNQTMKYSLDYHKLEDLMRQCFSSHDLDVLGFDLFDVKSEYFLAADMYPLLASLISTLFWLLLGLLFFASLACIYSLGLPIFSIVLVPFFVAFILSTSPGDLLVLFKTILPYMLLLPMIKYPLVFRHASKDL